MYYLVLPIIKIPAPPLSEIPSCAPAVQCSYRIEALVKFPSLLQELHQCEGGCRVVLEGAAQEGEYLENYAEFSSW